MNDIKLNGKLLNDFKIRFKCQIIWSSLDWTMINLNKNIKSGCSDLGLIRGIKATGNSKRVQSDFSARRGVSAGGSSAVAGLESHSHVGSPLLVTK